MLIVLSHKKGRVRGKKEGPSTEIKAKELAGLGVRRE